MGRLERHPLHNVQARLGYVRACRRADQKQEYAGEGQSRCSGSLPWREGHERYGQPSEAGQCSDNPDWTRGMTIHQISRAEDIAALRKFYRRDRRVPLWLTFALVAFAIAAVEFVLACWMISQISEGVIK